MAADVASLRATLEEVSQLLELSPDPPADLVSLKSELVELIHLRETAHLSRANSPAEAGPSQDSVGAGCDIVGRRCSLLRWSSRGHFYHQNAIIAESLQEASEASTSISLVRVFFANPTHLSDLPCSHYLSNNCPANSKCRLSHGVIVELGELSEWQEPSEELYLKENQPCLALPLEAVTEPAVWRHARILCSDLETGLCIVQWSLNSRHSSLESSVAQLPIARVRPIVEVNTEESSDSETTATGPLIEPSSPQVGEKASSVCLRGATMPQQPLGSWEVHTRRVGSRLLAKMGYTGVGGLGRAGNGRRLPVCLEEGFSRLSETPRKATPSRSTASRLFDFINAAVRAPAPPLISQKGLCKVPPSLKAVSKRDLNLQLYKTEREIKRVSQDMVDCEASIKRNESRDRKITAQARQRLLHLQSQLDNLNTSQRALVEHTTERQGVEKLRIF